MREQKQIERDHDLRKAQIDKFFTDLKKKVETENKEKASAQEDMEQRAMLKERARRAVRNVAIVEDHCTE